MKFGSRQDFVLVVFGCAILALLSFFTGLLGDRYASHIRVNGRTYIRTDPEFERQIIKTRVIFLCASFGFLVFGVYIWHSQLRFRPRIEEMNSTRQP